jgi:hypothetical protein
MASSSPVRVLGHPGPGPVRYGTSFNQRNDGVLCWHGFLKLVVDAAASRSRRGPTRPST